MTGPVDLVHRATRAQGWRYDGDADREQLFKWVISAGGEAATTHDGLLVKTPVKWAPVQPGWWVVRGVIGQFFVIQPEVYTGSYDRAEPLGFGADLSLSDGQVRALRTAAHETADVRKLREIVDQIAAAALERG